MDNQTDRIEIASVDESSTGDSVATAPRVWKSPQVIVGTLDEAQTGGAGASDGGSPSAHS